MAEDRLDTVKGEVEDITYSNEINGYTVCVIGWNDEPLTLVGTMPFLNIGETITAMGRFTNHPTFGKQFTVENYEKEMPATDSAMIAYLSSGAIKGIGPVLARRIVEKYGDETFSVLEDHPEYLEEIKGVTKKKAQQIAECVKKQFGLKNVIMSFNGILSSGLAMKVYKRYGDAAADIVKRNPYLLCDSISGIGFERADAIARSIGIDVHSHFRIECGMKYILKNNLNRNGNCYTLEDDIIFDTSKLLGVTRDEAASALRALSASGDVVIVKFGQKTAVYLAFAYKAEKYCAEKLKILASSAVKIPASRADKYIDAAQAEMGITFAPMQRNAISACLDNGLLIVTGGPGTGKTTVIRAMLKLFDSLDLDTLLAAPTGRAAKRMTQATGREARTIHRLLESGFTGENGYENETTFGRDEENPIQCNALIIDEISMCDVFLLSSLLRAVKPGTKLILIGDRDQLPPVGAGDTLRDMLSSGVLPVVTLDEVFRQSEGSDIVVNAHKINRGEMPLLDNKSREFFFMARSSAAEITDLISSLCSDRLVNAYGYNPLEDIQIITPSRKGSTGTVSLNRVIQSVLNPKDFDRLEQEAGDVVFREGDKVMQIKNNYGQEWEYPDGRTGQGVYNGEIGKIVNINNFEEYFEVDYDGRRVHYDLVQLDEIEHAYAVTVHKSQGSEYPCVIVPLFDAPPGLLSRNMLYTAVTRAKKTVIIIGRPELMRGMIENNRVSFRNTGLSHMLKSEEGKLPDAPSEDM